MAATMTINEMIEDAIQAHDEGCCSEAAPCATRVRLTTQNFGVVVGSTFCDWKDKHPSSHGYVGGNRSTPSRIDPTASEKQIDLIKRLAGERDYLSLGMTQRKLVEDVCNGTVIRKRSASELIDALMHTVKADASSLRPEFLDKVPATPASEKQIDFLQKLMAERGQDTSDVDWSKMDKALASKTIDTLLKTPVQKSAKVTQARVELEAGIYRVEDTIYKVQKAVHGSGDMYAKVLVVDGPGEARFEFAAGAIRNIRPEHRMTLDEAKQFGHVYGVCCQCGATLTDENSIEAGIGPVCARKSWG
jgi:hypothetical protein